MYKHWIENITDEWMNKWITNKNSYMMNARGKEEFCCNYLFIHLGYDACLVIGMNFYIQLNHNSCVVLSFFSAN